MKEGVRIAMATLLILILTVLLSGCGRGDGVAPPSPTAPSPPSQKYTLLVYMVGSDLESGCKEDERTGQIVCNPEEGGAATDDLEEMKQVGY